MFVTSHTYLAPLVNPNSFGERQPRHFVPVTIEGLANQEAATRERPTSQNKKLEDAVADARLDAQSRDPHANN